MLSHFNGKSYHIAFCLHHRRLPTLPLELIIVCKHPNRGCTLLNTSGVAHVITRYHDLVNQLRGNASDLVLARNCCLARMLPGEVELVSEWTGISGRSKSVKRFQWSNGLDTALYKNIPFYDILLWLQTVFIHQKWMYNYNLYCIVIIVDE